MSQSAKEGNVKKIIQGVFLLARGRREGINNFDGTREAFEAALAPQLAFLLMGLCVVLFSPEKTTGLILVLILFCKILMPAVISQLYAQRWQRTTALWLRYITAATWAGSFVIFVQTACNLLYPGFIAYKYYLAVVIVAGIVADIYLQWYIARVGLAIGGFKAALLYVSVLAAIAVMYVIAYLLPPHYPTPDDLMKIVLQKPHAK